MARSRFDYRKGTDLLSMHRNYVRRLLRLTDGYDTVLDVGCGRSSPMRYSSVAHLVGVDAYMPDLNHARQSRTHDDFVVGDVRRLRDQFAENSFDACVALDVIEHLPKADGYELISNMESIARRRVIFFTPNGFLPQQSAAAGDLQEHLSGWNAAEMTELGYDVSGAIGLRCLRDSGYIIRCRPRLVWGMISIMSQHIWCCRHPESAAGILCWKDLSKLPQPVAPVPRASRRQ